MPTYANYTFIASLIDKEDHIKTKWLHPFTQ